LKFPLRSSERNYDHPNFLYKWHTLQSASGQQLQLHVYLQYVDKRQYAAPSNFKHTMHVGWTRTGGFDVRNIPKEWMNLFQKAGISNEELANPETAAMLYNKIKEYEQENHIQFAPVTSPSPPPPPPPPPPQKFSSKGNATPPPSRPHQTLVNATVDAAETDFEGGNGNDNDNGADYRTASQNTSYGNDDDANITENTTGGESAESTSSSLQAQIRKGMQLRPVAQANTGSNSANNDGALEQHTNSLAALLAQAMDLRRNAIAAIQEEAADKVDDEENEWSDWDDEGTFSP
jgi:hypothetical protein